MNEMIMIPCAFVRILLLKGPKKNVCSKFYALQLPSLNEMKPFIHAIKVFTCV